MGETESRAEFIDLKLKREIVEIVRGAVREALKTDFPNDEPLTEKQAASLLGVKDQTLSVWRTKRIGPDFFYAGRHIKYLLKDVLEYREKHKVRTNGQAGRADDSE